MWGRPIAMTVAIVVSFSGCLQSSAVVCPDGRVCPAGSVCHSGGCAAGAQLDACEGRADGDSCDFIAGGVCFDGLCTTAFCGDGVVMAPEECEAGQLGTIATCQDLGYYEGGAITCTPSCEYDRSGCSGICGDEMIQEDNGEQCEAVGQVVADCTEVGFYYAGDVKCNDACRYNLSSCSGVCGDGVVDPIESCEAGMPYADSCVSFGYDAGSLGCRLCGPAFDNCSHLSWRRMQSASYDDVVAIHGTAQRLVALTKNGNVLDRVGTGWNLTAELPPPNSSTADRWKGVLVVSPDDVYAVGSTGVWHDNGTSWSALSTAPTTKYHGIARSPSGLLYLGTSAGVYTYDGTTWTLLPGSAALIPTVGQPDKIDFFIASASDVYVIVRVNAGPSPGMGDGHLWHYDGTTWSEPAGTAYPWQAVWGSSANDIYVGGRQVITNINNDLAVVSHFDGVAWTLQTLPGNANPNNPNDPDDHVVHSIWGSGADDVYALVAAAGVMHFDGSRWTMSSGPAEYAVVSGTGPREILAGGSIGAIDRYQGATWRSLVPLPAPPAGSNMGSNLSFAWGSSPNDVWFSTTNGMWHWMNGTWTAVPVTNADPSQLISFYKLFGLASNVIAATGISSTGPGIYSYDGATWTRIYTPARQITALWGSASDDFWGVGVAGSFPTTPPIIVHYDGTAWQPVTSPVAGSLTGVWGSSKNDVVIIESTGKIVRGNATGLTQVADAGVALYDVWGSGPDDVYAVGDQGTVMHWNGATWSSLDVGVAAPLRSVWGTGPDDVFVVGWQSEVRHFDGTSWTKVRYPVAQRLLGTVWGAGGELFVLGGLEMQHLLRSEPWSCRATETSCGDGVDDDCDGAFDGADADCRARLRLSELHFGVPDWIEVKNVGAQLANLDGMTLSWRTSADGVLYRYRFPSDAIARPGSTYRTVDTPTTLLANERVTGANITAYPGSSGWVALCAGECDLGSCSNILDYVEVQGVDAMPAKPPCATFMPGPLDVSSLPNSSLDSTTTPTRTGMTGGLAAGVRSDWVLTGTTRD